MQIRSTELSGYRDHKIAQVKAYYDTIGLNYAQLRKPDQRIAAMIEGKIGDARTIINVGAGTGSYEPKGRNVVAVEPSKVMIDQRPVDSAPVTQASAEDLPFQDKCFDVSLAILTVHHWTDLSKGLSEMKRVSEKQIIFTWDPSHAGFWLTQFYFPEILEIDKTCFPSFNYLEGILGPLEIETVAIPKDCTDGFGSAYWSRPEAYLSEEVRRSISTFNKLKDVHKGLKKLEDDLKTGRWDQQFGHLREMESLDLGLNILTSSN
jgi:SAM-dependent methyltransferase